MANRQLTVLNPSGYQELLQSADTLVVEGVVNMSNNLIGGLPAPSNDNDAARKKYVDDEIAGITPTPPSLQAVTTVGSTTTTGATFGGDVTGVNFIGNGSQLTGLASTLQEVTTNGSTTTTGATFGGGLTSNSLAVNSLTEIKSYGTIIAYRNDSASTSPIQKWNSNAGGNNTSIATLFCDGLFTTKGNIEATGTGKFVGDGSLLTNLPVGAQNLQDVLDEGNTATVGAEFGGNIGINKAAPDKALDVVGDTRLTGTCDITSLLSVNGKSSIASNGLITATRSTSTTTDFLQKWISDVGGAGTEVASITADGDLTVNSININALPALP